MGPKRNPSTRHCGGCGGEIAEGERFCGECGRPVPENVAVPEAPGRNAGEATPVSASPGDATERAKAKRSPFARLIVAVVAVLIVGGALYLAFRWLAGSNRDDSPPTSIVAGRLETGTADSSEATEPDRSVETSSEVAKEIAEVDLLSESDGVGAGDLMVDETVIAGGPFEEMPSAEMPHDHQIETFIVEDEDGFDTTPSSAPPIATPEINPWEERLLTLEKVMLFLEHGGNIEGADDSGRTLLHYAAMRGKAEIVGLLLAEGANVNRTDHAGRTPLHYSLEPEVTEQLLVHDADVKVQDVGGATPLHFAAMSGVEENVFLLLQFRAEVDTRNATGQTAQNIAEQMGFTELAQLLADF